VLNSIVSRAHPADFLDFTQRMTLARRVQCLIPIRTEAVMLENAISSAKSNLNQMGFVPGNLPPSATNRVDWSALSRDARLLDASIAGVVLSFNPRDDQMRERAERAWEVIRKLLAQHLFTDDLATPWSADAIGSSTACDLLKKRYSELRTLARTVAAVSFEHGSDREISSAGKALCRLAVKLDDLMDATERRLVNQLRVYVFSSGEEKQLSM
jgi:hypothetical protein